MNSLNNPIEPDNLDYNYNINHNLLATSSNKSNNKQKRNNTSHLSTCKQRLPLQSAFPQQKPKFNSVSASIFDARKRFMMNPNESYIAIMPGTN